MNDDEKNGILITTITPCDEKDIPRRNYRGDRPVEMDRTPVEVRGEPLLPIWWRGRQWAVTEYGIERLNGTYAIAADRLTENIDAWPWTMQLGCKTWVDAEDFTTAWLVALALHGCDVPAEKVRSGVRRGILPRNQR